MKRSPLKRTDFRRKVVEAIRRKKAPRVIDVGEDEFEGMLEARERALVVGIDPGSDGSDVALVAMRARGVIARIDGPIVSTPKHEYVRSEALREAYRLLPCQWEGCGIEDDTVCCAHSNWSAHGKGGRIKASDDRGASLCARHHAALDQGGSLARVERQYGWWLAHVRSVNLLVLRGWWPKSVPAPKTSTYPPEWALPEDIGTLEIS